MDKINILHVFPDEKFFDSTSEYFDSFKGVNNLYYLYKYENDCQLKFIKHKEKVNIINDLNKYKALFSSKNIDVIIFHSLRISFIKYVRFIDKQKIVVWWSWGGDIYNDIYPDVKPLIDWELYKPITKKYIQENNKPQISKGNCIIQNLVKLKHNYLLRKTIKRVDFFIPCITIDYYILKKKCSFFHADLFPEIRGKYKYTFTYHEKTGNILIGNSFTYTNNHLDIFEKIKYYSISDNQKYIIPINYGWGNAFNNNPDKLIKLCPLKQDSVIWLKEFLDRDEYFKLFNNVTHAIYGVLRQQALGNIFTCLSKGIKVYLYKDSVVAQYLKEMGYIFYTIDDDLTEDSLSTCLNQDEALHNFRLIEEMNSGKNIKLSEALLSQAVAQKKRNIKKEL